MQLTRNELIKETLRLGLGKLTRAGALAVDTGKFTGRAAKNRFITNSPELKNEIDWGSVNAPIPVELSDKLFSNIQALLGKQQNYTNTGFVAGLKVETTSTSPWHILFAKNMFREKAVPSFSDLEVFRNKTLKIYHAPYSSAQNLGIDFQGLDALIVLDPVHFRVAICGTAYAGEIKKSAFTMANFLLPTAGILPMHSSANCLADGSGACVLFGLSGTGKTTLSMSADRYLIGDDEIAWNPNGGLSNLEGGCYAKLIDLDEAKEPQIYKAVHQSNAILENTVLDLQGNVIFTDRSKAENTRGSFDIDDFAKLYQVYNQNLESKAPNSIVFLMADAFGAMPAVAKLNSEQAQYHFLSGYTAKVAGTEVGVKEPQAAFSSCFGAPFMPRAPSVYAGMLAKLAKEKKANIYLLNTGWTGGSFSSGAKRFPISVSRNILNSIQSGALADASFVKHPVFGFEVPREVPGVETKFLGIPQGSDVQKLAEKFKSNIKKFVGTCSHEVLEAGGPV